MDGDQIRLKTGITAKNGATASAYAQMSRPKFKRTSAESHESDSPKRARIAPPAASVTKAQVDELEHKAPDSIYEELGNDLEEYSSDDEQAPMNDKIVYDWRRKIKTKQIPRQTRKPAQNEIAKIIRQRKIRRLSPTSSYPDHPELDRPVADTRRATIRLFNSYGIAMGYRSYEGEDVEKLGDEFIRVMHADDWNCGDLLKGLFIGFS